jgi:hypothetical protein
MRESVECVWCCRKGTSDYGVTRRRFAMRQLGPKIGVASAVVVLIFANLSVAVQMAEAQLPKSGTGSIHSGYRGTGKTTKVGKDHMYWVGTYWGVSFNDEGKGFLHKMAWNCPAVSDIKKGVSNNKGLCDLTDKDGDKINGTWSNEGPMNVEIVGRFDITSGTGKYAGITGGWDIRCSSITSAQVYCHQKYSYKLP